MNGRIYVPIIGRYSDYCERKNHSGTASVIVTGICNCFSVDTEGNLLVHCISVSNLFRIKCMKCRREFKKVNNFFIKKSQ